jgi:hypothetical protein
VRPSQLTEARNISFWPGPIRRESGCRQYNTGSIFAPITSGYAWPADPAAGGFNLRHVLTLGNGSIVRDQGDGNFGQLMASGLGAFTFTPAYAEAGEESPGRPPLLAMALAPNPPRVITGTTNSADLIPAAPTEFAQGPPTVVLHEGRLWWGLGHRVWFSSPTDHLKYLAADGGGSIDVYPGDGDFIVMLMSYKGLLLVWKYPGGIYAVDTASVEVTGWRVTRITQWVGALSPRAGVILDNEVLFIDHGGNLQLLSGITAYGLVGSKNLSVAYNLAEWMQDTFNPARYRQSVMVYSPARREVHIALTAIGSLTNDRRLVLDFNMPETIRARLSDRDRCDGLWTTRDGNGTVRPVCGGDDQRVWLLDEPGVLKTPLTGAAIGYASIFATPPMDLGDPLHRKNGLFIEVVGDSTGAMTFYIDVEWDHRPIQTIEVTLGGGGTPFRLFRLGVTRLAGLVDYRQRRRLVGSGHRLKLTVRAADHAVDFSVSRLWLSGGIGDERHKPDPDRAPTTLNQELGRTRARQGRPLHTGRRG